MTKEQFKKIWGWVWPILIALTVVLLTKYFFIDTFNVSGSSMAPNLEDRQKVFSFKRAKVQRGSVIVFNAKGVDPGVTEKKIYVKRVFGLPGDKVVSKDGKIYVNDQLVNQDFISSSQRKEGTGNWDFKQLANLHQWGKFTNVSTVPEGYYFVLGDNRKVSNDSRYFGFVPKDHVLGVIKSPIWNGINKNINSEQKHFFANAMDN
ncbi:signal peptidase I (plasmid) [Lactobacillus sp. PV037]|uniref:signal peptidase I n=1 Tax=Lactobacillus sp. PV037 TaxID=2594496 RepID=UPI00223F43B5|nr:signal peptidase I [Lactobacillus sp. PV037]QNQ82993.1 signal peptidase I [Lactobacillus sp. PV037]